MIENSPLGSAVWQRDFAVAQRRLLIGGGGLYGLGALWVGYRGYANTLFSDFTLTLLAAVLAIYGLTYLREERIRQFIVPILTSVVFAAHIVFGVAVAPMAGAVRFALLFGLLGLFVAHLSTVPRAVWISLAAMSVIGLYGATIYLPGLYPEFSRAEALVYWLPFLAATVVGTQRLVAQGAATVILRQELERRATSDGLTGVSNRAHVTQLAQNEFARARRYGEDFSCLVIEIDAHGALVEKCGIRAADTVAQMLTGYCVVVMRHCDSLGRMSPSRYLALLPETAGAGALVLAERMCRDTAGLSVAVDGQTLNFTVSIGAAAIHALDRAAGDLLRRAVLALDDALEHGNRAVLAAHPGLLDVDEAFQGQAGREQAGREQAGQAQETLDPP
ncbi:MAG: GGDEF domain-containing protein [Rhodospirillaceae bacterium]|nr:GGDEF domain-containing protein [Rhodospirillaceae bacterium]